MTYYARNGNSYLVSPTAAVDLRDSLPVGTYTVKYNQMAGSFYLEMIADLEVSGKIYGDTMPTAKKILNTFMDRPNSTGVMLSGEKGSGKTMLAKILAREGHKLGYPTIVINQPWCGEEFNAFIQTMDQPLVIIFDEFEKVYEREDQEKMLTLLDGVYPSKKLFVITCNDKYRVNDHMKNRPGRIYYRLEYTGLDRDFIIEYCEDNLLNKSHIDSLCRIAFLFKEFNFDILKAVVEEMNRYDETPQEVLKMLNAKPEMDEASLFEISSLKVKGKLISEDDLYSKTLKVNPFAKSFRVDYTVADKKEEDGYRFESVTFDVSNLVTVDSTSGNFEYATPRGDSLFLQRPSATVGNVWDAF